jgi:putative PIN family toxin of toxin-antitoxin system
MKHKPTIVLDTNTIISALLIPDSNPGKAFELTLREALPVISSETFCELQSKVLLPKFDRYVSSDDRQQFLRRFLLLATLVPVSTIVHDCRDPKDTEQPPTQVGGFARVAED